MNANSRAVLVLGLLPFTPFVVALITYAPMTGTGVVPLAGTWAVLDASALATLDAAAVDAAPVTARVPGPVPGLVRQILIARVFDVDSGHPLEPQLLVFGGVSNGVAGLFVNGHPVGEEGVRSIGYKLEHVGLSSYFVDSTLLRPGRNVVAALISPESDTMASIQVALVDRRLTIGPYTTLRPWFDSGRAAAPRRSRGRWRCTETTPQTNRTAAPCSGP